MESGLSRGSSNSLNEFERIDGRRVRAQGCVARDEVEEREVKEGNHEDN